MRRPFHYWRSPLRTRNPLARAVDAEPLPPSVWAAQSLHFHPDPRQAEILDAPPHRIILLCTRQFGKSSLSALKATHFALYHPGSLTVVAAPRHTRSAEWIRLVRRHLKSLKIPVPTDRIHPHSVVLPNGARLVALPGVVDNNRGYPADLLIFEEAAIIPDEMFQVLTGSLAATDGHLWLLSSAGRDAGFFYEQWHSQQAAWTRFKVTAPECPRISAEFLEQERLLIGDQAFRREFLCEFETLGEKLLSRDLILSAVDPGYKAWNGGHPLCNS